MAITVNTTGLMASSGFDVQALADAMIQASAAPEQPWKDQQTTLTNETAALKSLSSDLASLNTSVESLNDIMGAFAQRVASSSDNSVVSASASSAAATGQHTVTVTSLATKAVYYSKNTNIPSGDSPLSGGSMTIAIGTKSQTIDIGGNTNTLNAIASSINGLSMGVTASVVNTSNGAELAVVSNSTGKANDISLTTSSDSALSFTKSSDGKDADVSIDGVPVPSASNTISNAIPGVTLQINGQEPGHPITISVGTNTDAVTRAINNFVSSYNQITKDINAQFAYSTGSGSAGPLAGDSTVRMVQDELFQAISGISVSSSVTPTLGNLGITMNDDGTLSVDSSALNAALASQFSDVQTFFQDPQQGFATQLQGVMSSLTDSTSGPFLVELQSISNMQNDLADAINDFESRLAAQRQALVAQLTQANQALQSLPLELARINAELGIMPTTSSSNKNS